MINYYDGVWGGIEPSGAESANTKAQHQLMIATDKMINAPGVAAATSWVIMNCAEPANTIDAIAMASNGGMPALTASTP